MGTAVRVLAGLLLLTAPISAAEQKEAAQLYRTAAELGEAQGMHNLAGLLAGGRGVRTDSEEAALWAARAISRKTLSPSSKCGRTPSPEACRSAKRCIASSKSRAFIRGRSTANSDRPRRRRSTRWRTGTSSG